MLALHFRHERLDGHTNARTSRTIPRSSHCRAQICRRLGNGWVNNTQRRRWHQKRCAKTTCQTATQNSAFLLNDRVVLFPFNLSSVDLEETFVSLPFALNNDDFGTNNYCRTQSSPLELFIQRNVVRFSWRRIIGVNGEPVWTPVRQDMPSGRESVEADNICSMMFTQMKFAFRFCFSFK